MTWERQRQRYPQFLALETACFLYVVKYITIVTICFIYYIVGPLFGAFFKRFGPVVTLLTCAMLTSIGFIAASRSHSSAVLILFMGVFRGDEHLNKVVYLFEILLLGIGSGMGFLGVFTITGKTYNHHTVLANNLLGATSASFAAILAPLLQKGIDAFTWHGTMLIQGALALNMVPLGWLIAKFFKQLTREDSTTENQPTNIKLILANAFDVGLLHDLAFVLYCVANIGVQTPRVMQAIYLVRYAQSIGIPDDHASRLLTVYFSVFIVMVVLCGVFTSRLASHASKHSTFFGSLALVTVLMAQS